MIVNFRNMLLFGITMLCASISQAQNSAPLMDCPQAANAENYELWAIVFVEGCDPSSGQLEAIGDALTALVTSEGNIPVQLKVDVLKALLDKVMTLDLNSPNVSKVSVEAFVLALQCDINQLENNLRQECEQYKAEGNALRTQKWQTIDVSGSAYRHIFLDVFDEFSPDCLGQPVDESSDCHLTMVNQMAPVLELYNIMSKVLVPAINKDIRNDVADRYRKNQLQWKSYVQDTGFQYPWELTFNKKRNGAFREVALGRPAPTQRWVLLHPTAGLYHSEKLPDGDQTELVGIIEIIGKKRWKYNADNKPESMMGISLTSTFADIAGIEDVGYGIMAEYNGFALGISRHGNQQIVILNIELQHLLSARPRSFTQWLMAARN